MTKERVVVLDNSETLNVKQQQINYNLTEDTTSENASIHKEIVIVFEEDNSQINIIPNTIEYDLSSQVKVGGMDITNTDGTLTISSKGTTTNINTNVIQRYETHYEFPNRGKENVIYIDLSEGMIYYWEKGEYKIINDYDDIKIINGGEA